MFNKGLDRESDGQRAHGVENPRRPYVTGLTSGFTLVVRGSSRRRLIVLARHCTRSTNIRVINRRYRLVDCRILYPASKDG